jgi:RHS repeat-associated protein
MSYTYDVLSRLISAQTDSGVFSYEYSGANTLIQKFIRPNGSFTEYVYNDPIKRLTEIVNKKDDQSIISKSAYMYTDRDVVGTETVTNGSPIKTFQDGLITYEYNKVNQLLAANNQQETFNYDADGNLIKSFTPDGYILNMGYDAENRLIWSEYIDDNQITHRTEYKYTGDHCLAEIKKLENGTQVSVTRMIRDGILSLQDRNESNQIISEYLWGDNFGGGIGRLNAARINDNNYYHLYDGRGNVKAVIDNTQNVAASYSYGPFGELRATTGTVLQPYQFSTKRLDERTGLLYYGYRHYSSSFGRWTARDPVGFKGGDINLYRFVQNDPINLIDPYGLWSIWGGSTGVAAWGPWGGNAGSGFAFDSDAGAGAYTTTGTTEGAGLSVGYEVGFYTGSICGETEIVSFGAGPVSIGFVSDYKGSWGFVIGAAKGAPIEATMSVNDTLFFPFSGDETNPCQ